MQQDSRSHIFRDRKLSDALREILQEEEKHHLQIEDFVARLEGRGVPMMIMMIALPFCQPIPLLGLSTPLGLLLVILGVRVCGGWDVWYPKSIAQRDLPVKFISLMRRYALPWAEWIERWVKPRLYLFSHHVWARRLIGLNVMGLGVLLALPLPIPFSNVIAAWPVVFLALGMIERDGIVIALGHALSLAAYAFFVVVMVVGVEIFRKWLLG
ncbi:MAG: exopolysaccharide biosynthesis protein [Methylacidiphilales bacterium]|nr:exopolysaccharide biosynthesis protein [Candidatus Methylacidiphilales bacterium]MDW8349534.1 exopolysaccharide biosynthesis protein [Verrucomicrobiae bacterium]